jgi:5-(carboxyamino)imidazole ribonucleotide mutase
MHNGIFATLEEVIAFVDRGGGEGNPALKPLGLTGEEREGYEVLVACAGYAAHLPGVIASLTTLPVIGVPLDTSPLRGEDALLSIVQMPGGIPVAAVSIGKAGVKNAAVLAAEILALKYPAVKTELAAYRKELARG